MTNIGNNITLLLAIKNFVVCSHCQQLKIGVNILKTFWWQKQYVDIVILFLAENSCNKNIKLSSCSVRHKSIVKHCLE